MRFTEFYNRNKNVISETTRKKIASSIPISEDRDAFFKGDTFKRDDIVESAGVKYRVLEKCSNYFQVMNEAGGIERKFAKDLVIVEAEFPKVSDITGVEESADPVKQLKEFQMDSYKSKDKLTIAKMIADAVGIPYDVVSSPDNLVNAAVRKAAKDPALLKNKAIIQNMLTIADSVGIKVMKSVFDKEMSESRSHEEIAADEYHNYAAAVKKGDSFKAKTLKAKIDFHRKKMVKPVQESKPYPTVSTKGKKLVSAGEVMAHAKKLAGEGKKATLSHMRQAREELMKEGFEVANLTLKDLKSFLSEGSPENAAMHAQLQDVPEQEVDAEDDELPHGHTFNGARSETHRKQIIKKLRGI
jgi:hypothetical protein